MAARLPLTSGGDVECALPLCAWHFRMPGRLGVSLPCGRRTVGGWRSRVLLTIIELLVPVWAERQQPTPGGMQRTSASGTGCSAIIVLGESRNT